VTRLLVVLGILSLLAISALIGVHSGSFRWLDARTLEFANPALWVASGVSVTSLITWVYMRLWFGRLINAAEKIAEGNLDVRVTERGGGLDGRLAKAINGIAALVAERTESATVDKLTGVANRQQLLATLFSEVERASRYQRAFSVAFVDIDYFKAVNDTYGHAAGDLVLRGVAQTIQSNLRSSDLVGRYGGEEFMLLLSETDAENAAALAEKLRPDRAPALPGGWQSATQCHSVHRDRRRAGRGAPGGRPCARR